MTAVPAQTASVGAADLAVPTHAAADLHCPGKASDAQRRSAVVIRDATIADAGAIHALIVDHLAEGHLLPRDRAEIEARARRFLVAARDGRAAACAELAPLSRDVSEIRSLVVSRDLRSLGVGMELIDRLVERATAAGFGKLCAFTHEPAYFMRAGFSIVPHVWLPEKIVTDCHACPHFRRCGQYAVVRPLDRRPAAAGGLRHG